MKVNWLKFLNYFYLSKENLSAIMVKLVSLFYLRVYLVILIIFNILNWLSAYYINKNISQNLVILHYNVNLGVNLIGEAAGIYIIPTLGLFFILFNLILLINLHQQGKFIIHLLMSAAIIANVFLLAATFSIYLINFR